VKLVHDDDVGRGVIHLDDLQGVVRLEAADDRAEAICSCFGAIAGLHQSFAFDGAHARVDGFAHRSGQITLLAGMADFPNELGQGWLGAGQIEAFDLTADQVVKVRTDALPSPWEAGSQIQQ
jgi:hypothetical protein